MVEQNGTCGFFFNGKVRYSGTCKWETPSAKGGILDLQYPDASRARPHSLERYLGKSDNDYGRW